jgi:hypothetical protein
LAIFFSYSHSDKEVAHSIAVRLSLEQRHVWIDEWELQVGDSLLRRIEDAVGEASALLVVLSPASVESEWVRKELTAGLVRELEERRVIVLPVLVKDCNIPLFLRDKKYADFRTDFEAGCRAILNATAALTSTTLGREGAEDGFTDWAIDWFETAGHFAIRLTIIEHRQQRPFSILTEMTVVANDAATRRYRQYADAGFDAVGRQMILEGVRSQESFRKLALRVEESLPASFEGEIVDPKIDHRLHVHITTRRVGSDHGRDGGNEVHALPRQHGPAGHAFGRLSPPSRRVGQALTLDAIAHAHLRRFSMP